MWNNQRVLEKFKWFHSILLIPSFKKLAFMTNKPQKRYFSINFVYYFFRNKSKMQIMALMFKLLRLNMRDIKKSTKSLINSKAMLKNVARPRFDSTVKSSKFMVKEWPSYKRPTTSSLSFLTKESRTCTHYTISSHQRTQNWPGSMKR